MEINLKTAVQTLNNIDKQLRDQAKIPAKSGKQTLLDSVELSTEARQNLGPIKSPSASDLYAELGDQLSSLTSLVGNAAEKHKSLSAMFADPKSTDELREKAQELLDGYFNVDNTSSRIFNFAFSFYDGSQDRETFAREMQGHIHEGFRQAEKLLGGLADISIETRDRLDQMVDDFIKDGEEEKPQQGISIEA